MTTNASEKLQKELEQIAENEGLSLETAKKLILLTALCLQRKGEFTQEQPETQDGVPSPESAQAAQSETTTEGEAHNPCLPWWVKDFNLFDIVDDSTIKEYNNLYLDEQVAVDAILSKFVNASERDLALLNFHNEMQAVTGVAKTIIECKMGQAFRERIFNNNYDDNEIKELDLLVVGMNGAYAQ